MSKILALDFGTKRIGVAISDESSKLAFPRDFIPTKKKEDIFKLIAEEGVEAVLIGMPKSLSGGEAKFARGIREFAAWLKSKIEVPIVFVDERFSTRDAQGKLKQMGVKSRFWKSQIDSLSAYTVLQAYLGSKKSRKFTEKE